jgi:23S rRNA pseudouridine2604 synthase
MKLTRVRVMNIKLEDLAPGKWRYLTIPEIDKLTDLVSTSVKTEEASYVPPKPQRSAKKTTDAKEQKAPGAPTKKTTSPKEQKSPDLPAKKQASKRHSSFKDFRSKKKR